MLKVQTWRSKYMKWEIILPNFIKNIYYILEDIGL